MSFAGRKGDAVQVNQRSGHLFLCAEMVARQQEAALGRSIAAAALCRCCEQDRDAVDQDKYGEIEIFNCSPDSHGSRGAAEENGMSRVYLYSSGVNRQTAVTDNLVRVGEPVFSDDGKYLLLGSARDFKATLGDEEFANV